MKSKIDSMSRSICLAVAVLVFASPTFAKRGGPGPGPGIPLMTPVITAEQAVGVVTAALPKLATDKYWVRTGPRGDTKLNVALILDGKIVSRVELNPATGEILPKGQAIFVNHISADPDEAVNRVRQVIPNLQVAAARLGKEGEWKVELTLNRAVIADIDVHSRDSSILTDWGASREATLN
ncbi:MAG: hypothetical protein ACLP5H_34590 [Desulfomonilaceae bacterium]